MEIKDTSNMSGEELDAYLKELNTELERLRPIVEENKKKEAKKFDDLAKLFIELSEYKKNYYDNRLILSEPLFDISDEDYAYIESTMPILKEKIRILEEDIRSFTTKLK